jgi:hypothetical protein
MHSRLTASFVCCALVLPFAAHAENIWQIEKSAKSVTVSVNGKITHGDRLRIGLLPKRCDVGHTYTTFYTYKQGQMVSDIKNVIAPAKFRDIKINVKILSAKKFLMGYMLFVNIGSKRLEDIKKFFAGRSEVSLSIEDSAQFIASDFLDIRGNSWSLNGLSDALDKGKAACETL